MTPTSPSPTPLPSALGRAQKLIDEPLRNAVSRLEPSLAAPARYHMGWTDAEGNPADTSPGKGIRSALAILGAEAVAAPAVSAIPAAVAVDLIHNFSLIHDDIIDDDRLRRHRPTLWTVFGVGPAIIVGDALHTLAFEIVLGSEPDQRRDLAARMLGGATTSMIAGQAQDMKLDGEKEPTLAACIEMESAKTGALLSAAVAMGAILGGGPSGQVEGLSRYGSALGIAFQATDDVMGIWGTTEETGKPAGNDLRERKISMPVAIAFERGGSLGDQVRSTYASPPDAATISALTEAMTNAGIREEVDALANDQLDAAVSALDCGIVAGPAEELAELARFVANRRH